MAESTPPKPNLKPTPSSVLENQGNWFSRVLDWFRGVLDLTKGIDREQAVTQIKKNMKMEGSNAAMLICSIMIASLGLDLDSAAVIIGAMLISPLMSPILGIGLGIGTNDTQTAWTSLGHLIVSVLIAVLTSWFYFEFTFLAELSFNTPETLNPQIKGRTAPGILDAMVATFGGIAGIISVTRKDQSNAIPGVAIATALMPPLCVTGFGLAHGDVEIISKSFFLFFLNVSCIIFTSVIMIVTLGFTQKKYQHPSERKKSLFILVSFFLFVLVCSILIYRDARTQASKEFAGRSFIKHHMLEGRKSYLINFKCIDGNEDQDTLLVFYSGARISDVEMDSLKRIAKNELTKLDSVELLAYHMASLDPKHINELEGGLQEVEYQDSLQRANYKQFQQSLRQTQHFLIADQTPNILLRLRDSLPDLEDLTYSNVKVINDTTSAQLPEYYFQPTWAEGKRSAQNYSQLYDLLVSYNLPIDSIRITNLR